MTLLELANLNAAKNIHQSHPNNLQLPFPAFLKKLSEACDADPQTRTAVCRAVEAELEVLRAAENPNLAGGDPKNNVFNNLFNPLFAYRKPAEVARGSAGSGTFSEVVSPFQAKFIKQ